MHEHMCRGWPEIARVAKVIFSNIIALRALHDAHLSIQPAYMNTVQANNNIRYERSSHISNSKFIYGRGSMVNLKNSTITYSIVHA